MTTFPAQRRREMAEREGRERGGMPAIPTRRVREWPAKEEPQATLSRITERIESLDPAMVVKWRRERDSNPRYGVNRIHAFQACAFDHSAISPHKKKSI